MGGWLEGITVLEEHDPALRLAQDECRVRLGDAREWLLATSAESPDAGLARENFFNAVATAEEWGCIGRDGMWV